MATPYDFIWDYNGTNSVEPSQALFDDGYAASAVPTSGNINWLFNAFTLNRHQVGAYLDFGALLSPAPEGWLYCDGTTIGSSTSGAETANDDFEALFTFLWTYNAGVTVSPSKGASAAADWAANKTITLPKHDGTVLSMKSSVVGSALNVDAGTLVGTETVSLTESNLPQIELTVNDPGHEHSITTAFNVTQDGPLLPRIWDSTEVGTSNNTNSATTGITIDPIGGDPSNQPNALPHNNIQPTVVCYRLIKW